MKNTIITLGAILALSLVALGAKIDERKELCRAELVGEQSYVAARLTLEVRDEAAPVVASLLMERDGVASWARAAFRPWYEAEAYCYWAEEEASK